MTGIWRFQIDLTQPQYEVLREITRASGDTVQEWLQDCVLSMLRSDIELYFGTSEAIVKELNQKLQIAEKEAA
jgi:hypothetical protein